MKKSELKYVYVSGGGSGIGFEVAMLCVKKGFIPVILGRDEEKLKMASEKLNQAPYLSVDLSKSDSKKVIQNHLKTLPAGHIKALVNNAGVYMPSSFLESTPSDWSDQFNINVMSAVYLSQALFKELKEEEGSIVNVSSTLGMRPISNASAYSASKSAMNSLTQSMALEFAEHGVRVNAVCPGIVQTPIHKQSLEKPDEWREMLSEMQPMGRVGETTDIAPTILHLIENSNWTTGALINIDGGILLNS